VITTVLSEEIATSIKHLGADRVIDVSKEHLPGVLRGEFEAGRGVDIAIDCLGGSDAGQCLPYLNRGGRWIVIASLAGDLTSVDLRNLYVRGTRLIGTTLRSRTPEFKEQLLQDMVRVIWPRIERREVLPTIWKTYPISGAEEAHAMMREGKNIGKIVLLVRE
jgi:NADPH2:quinone reductase